MYVRSQLVHLRDRAISELGQRDDTVVTPSNNNSFNSPGSREWAGIISAIVISILATIFFVLRMWNQKQRRRLFAADNVLLMIAFVLMCAMQVINGLLLVTDCIWAALSCDDDVWVVFAKVMCLIDLKRRPLQRDANFHGFGVVDFCLEHIWSVLCHNDKSQHLSLSNPIICQSLYILHLSIHRFVPLES